MKNSRELADSWVGANFLFFFLENLSGVPNLLFFSAIFLLNSFALGPKTGSLPGRQGCKIRSLHSANFNRLQSIYPFNPNRTFLYILLAKALFSAYVFGFLQGKNSTF